MHACPPKLRQSLARTGTPGKNSYAYVVTYVPDAAIATRPHGHQPESHGWHTGTNLQPSNMNESPSNASHTKDDTGNSLDGDAFKRIQTRHRKSSHILTDEVIDFRRPSDSRVIPVSSSTIGLAPSSPRLYGLSTHPGFVFAPACLSPDFQERLAYQSLSQYCEHPHRTNIDLVPIKPDTEEDDDRRIWEIWKAIHNFDGQEERGKKRQRKEDRGTNTTKKAKQLKPYRSPKKLSWATMGYHYDWTHRTYTEAAQSELPIELQQLSEELLKMLPNCGSFKASAAIVNYYNHKSLMRGHRDELEYDFTKPVISMSLGLSAIFLLGGKTREEPPVPLLIRPGDVMFLAGESRLAYHGMAKVVPNEPECDALRGGVHSSSEISLSLNLKLPSIPESERLAVKGFLSSHRININLRQVLPDGVNCISDLQTKEVGL